MKILVTSDVVSPEVYNERIDKRFSDVELVLSCGDLPYDYLEYIVSALNVPLLYVHGNHDRPLLTDTGEILAPAGCTNIEGRVVKVKGLLIGGLGGSKRYAVGSPHQYTDREMWWRIRRLASRLWRNWALRGRAIDILVTHAPPYGIHDEADPAHQGFKPFLTFMQKYHPSYLIHGHTFPQRSTPARTRYANTDVVQVYGYRVLEVDVG